MFSRYQMIQGAFDRAVEENADAIIQEVEEQSSVVFHTLGDLDQYKGLLLTDEEEDEIMR